MELAMVHAVVNQGKDGTTKLSNMIIASFGDKWNLVGKGKMFIEDEAKVARSRVGGVKREAVYLVKLLL